MTITADPDGSWSERNIGMIADCIDSGFANVLSAEFDRITTGMSDGQISAWLQRSEQSINRLRTGGDMPDYSDPMVVLRYVILYQLGHINLAYTLIKDSNSGQKLTDTGRLQVVDFGAGTLAMSFGVTLAVADALADGEDISTVLIETIDTGRPMMELGLKLWHEFINQVDRKDEMAHLAQAARLVQHYLHDDRRSVQNERDWDCWLSALHTIYDDNEALVRSVLDSLCNTLNPGIIALTCYSGKSDIANRVLPNRYKWEQDREPQLRFGGSINPSAATGIAFDRGFQPSTWYQYNRNLYTDCYDVATFTSQERQQRQSEREREEAERQQLEREQERQQRQQEEARRHSEQVSRPASTPKQPSPEAERLRERQRRAREVQQREAKERERQRQQQEEARRRSETPRQTSPEEERWRRIQEEVRQRLEQERQQRQQSESQHHVNRGVRSKIQSGLSRLFRRRRK